MEVVGVSGDEAKKTISDGYKAFDIAARKNAIPKKRADRKKSRLSLRFARAK